MTAASGSYLRYLPAIYAEQSAPFLAGFLDIFQKLMTGLDDDQLGARKGIQQLLGAEVIGELFYPRLGFLFPDDATPIPPISGLKPREKAAVLGLLDSYIGVPEPSSDSRLLLAAPRPEPDAPVLAWLNAFLAWLAGWVDLVLVSDWSIDKKRLIIAQILALQRVRGTAQGLSWLSNLWFDLPLTLTGTSRADPTTEVSGLLTVTIANPVSTGIALAARAGTPQTFVLRDRAAADVPLVSGYAPWLFDIVVTLPTAKQTDFILTADNVQRIRTLLTQLRGLIDQIRPVGSGYRILLVPGMCLGIGSANLGINTLL